MPKFSIVIPVCGNEEMTRDCIKSIRENTLDFEIIVVDNGSDPAWSGVDGFIRNNENLGFPKAVNQGIKASTGEVVVILNNDTIVSPHWLEYLDEHLKKFDLVGPCTNNISGIQQVACTPYAGKDGFYKTAEKFHSENQNQSIAYHRLVFFCVAIKREVIKKIGLLDDIFSPGNFEDDDYCLRAIEAGFKVGIANDVLIYHIGSATHKALNVNFQNLMKNNEAIFKKKWPVSRYSILQGLNVRNCQDNPKGKAPTLALVMIVKNEEKGLENAILSVRGIVDEVVVAVDDSSTDRTLEIARRLANTVKTYVWEDDFAKARNLAHDGVKSDYIIFLDGHEYLKQGDTIKEHLKKGGDGFLCSVELDNNAVIRNPRIYKNGFQFEGKVHELQQNLIPQHALDVIVRHDRINSQEKQSSALRDKQRDDQIPRIMGEQLRQNPKNCRAAFHLALHYQTKSEFKKSIKCQNQFLKYSKNHPERWYIYFNQAFCYLALGRNFRAWLAAGCAERETPLRWEISKLRGLICFGSRNFERALTFFLESFNENTGDVSYKPWGRDIDGTWNLMGECFFNLDRYFEASEAFRQASVLTKSDEFRDLMLRRASCMREGVRL